MTQKNIILVGLGPHAQRIYYPLLEKYANRYQIQVPLVVDLQDQQDKIEQYLAHRALQPQKVHWLESQHRLGETLDEKLTWLLEQVVAEHPHCSMIIATEPKAHKPYLYWALERNIDVLMDKPITAPMAVANDVAAAQQIFADYLEIEQRLQKSKSNVIVQCQRRSHEGYQLVKAYLEEFIPQFQVPISYLEIYHGDGMWCMPTELFQRENHPYKYGYGKLMHSGYHFVDLFAWLLEVNHWLEDKKATDAELFVSSFRAYDFLQQVGATDYARLFCTDRFVDYFTAEMQEQAKAYGELDVFIQCQLKRADAVVTTASINLQQNSFSRRAWVDPAVDTYKGNGRVRHEKLNVQVGNLLNIQVHSYQSHEVGKPDKENAPTAVGGENHFDIHIFRNNKIVGGKALEKLAIGEAYQRQAAGDISYLGHNERAREVNFCDFLEGKRGVSHLSAHRMTNYLLAQIYRCMAQKYHNELPYTTFSLT